MNEFKWEYCSHCDTMMVICPKCGNNTCNSGYGEVNGETCDVCPDAYKYMKEHQTPPRPLNWEAQFRQAHLRMTIVFNGKVTEKHLDALDKLVEQRKKIQQS